MNNPFLKIFIIICLFGTVTPHILGQDYTFKILTFSGDVFYRDFVKTDWKKAQTGILLKKDFEIKLNEKSYAALVYKDERAIELFQEGIFKIIDVEKDILKSAASVGERFTKFVAQEIITDKSQKKDMKTFAAVVRVKPNHIDAAIPAYTKVVQPEIELKWFEYPETEQYTISILNESNALIFMDVVEDTSYRIEAALLRLKAETRYKWYITDASNPKISSDTNIFYFYSEKNTAAVQDTLEMLTAEIQSNETPLNILGIAEFYRRHELNINVFDQLKKVVSIVPSSEEYKQFFAKFLIENKMYLNVSELFEEKLVIYEN